jgi:hypothetical protein
MFNSRANEENEKGDLESTDTSPPLTFEKEEEEEDSPLANLSEEDRIFYTKWTPICLFLALFANGLIRNLLPPAFVSLSVHFFLFVCFLREETRFQEKRF